MLGYGLGTNSMILNGFAVSYGEIVIVIPDTVPATFQVPKEPLIWYHQNTYDGIILHLGEEWTAFLVAIQAEIHLVSKQYYVSEDKFFDVLGVFNSSEGTVSFNLSVDDTDLLPAGKRVRWEIAVRRTAPDFNHVIVKGNVQIEPTLRRVR